MNRLTLVQEGAYNRFLEHWVTQGTPISENALESILGAKPGEDIYELLGSEFWCATLPPATGIGPVVRRWVPNPLRKFPRPPCNPSTPSNANKEYIYNINTINKILKDYLKRVAGRNINSKTSKPVKGRERGTTLPEGWAPNELHRKRAAELGVDLELEAEAFVDWAVANGRAYRDWDAAFRNWIRNSKRFSDERGTSGTPGAKGSQNPNMSQEEARALDEAKRGLFGKRAQREAEYGEIDLKKLVAFAAKKRQARGEE